MRPSTCMGRMAGLTRVGLRSRLCPPTATTTSLRLVRASHVNLPANARGIPSSFRQQLRTQTTSTQADPSQVPPPPPPPRPGSLSPFFSILLIAGLGAIGYGIYDIYGTLTLWPPEVRKDLRAGLRAKYKGDLDLTVWYFTRAWEISKTLPPSAFGAHPHLKTSGIALALAETLEMDHKPDKAFNVYADALNRLRGADVNEGDVQVGPASGNQGTNQGLSPPERLRAISISYKLGELAHALGKEKEEEEYLTWAVEAILHVGAAGGGALAQGHAGSTTQSGAAPANGSPSAGSITQHDLDTSTHSMLSELSPSPWASKTDLAAPFEALGTFYAQHGKEHYALPLYLHAISILIPPPPAVSGREERCRGAQLMSNLSELILRRSGTDLAQAESWALKALDIATQTREQAPKYGEPTCEVAYAVALFNVGAIRRMAGDNEKAKVLLEMSRKQSEAIGMIEGVEHAKEALEQIRLEEATRKNV